MDKFIHRNPETFIADIGYIARNHSGVVALARSRVVVREFDIADGAVDHAVIVDDNGSGIAFRVDAAAKEIFTDMAFARSRLDHLDHIALAFLRSQGLDASDLDQMPPQDI